MSKRIAVAVCLVIGELVAGACLIIGIWVSPDYRELMFIGMAIQLAIAAYWTTSAFKSRSEASPSDAGLQAGK